MDTKLISRHKIGIILAILTVLGASFIMVGLYPYFEKNSSEHKTPVYEGQSFLSNLVYGNYVLSVEEAEREKGQNISPYEVFFPSLPAPERAYGYAGQEEIEDSGEGIEHSSEDYYETDVQSHIYDREFEFWERRFGGIRQDLEYQVLSGSGELLKNASSSNDLVTDEGYPFKVIMRYDDAGDMEVVSVVGSDMELIKGTLEHLGSNDPMSDYYTSEFQYEYHSLFSYPKDITFVYAMTQEKLKQYDDSYVSIVSSYYDSGAVSLVFAGLMAAVAVFSFLFSSIAKMDAMKSRILRIPLEIVAGITLCGFAFGDTLIRLVVMTNQGHLYNELIRADFLPSVATLMVRLWNILWWSVPFAVIYLAVLCIRDIFNIGLRRYIRERTLIGLTWGFCKCMLRYAMNFLQSIDLQEESNRLIWKLVGINFLLLAVICFFGPIGLGALMIYSILLFVLLRKCYRDLMRKYKVLLNATGQIAEGNLDVVITEELGLFNPFVEEIRKIQQGFKVAVEEEVRSQNLKTDLITNVSHDLKTPLTAIITYISLIKDDVATEEQRHKYIDVLEQKSMRLKALIDDLFEISKATSNNITLNLVDVDIVSLLKEVSFELSDKIGESAIDFRWNLPEEKIILTLDSQKTYRIFENLLINIIKYAMPNSRAYIDLKKEDGYVKIFMKNISANELNYIDQSDITERFVRGDQARNTEGSGLGLAIAKSFVEVQKGKLEIEVEADLFRVIISWPAN